MYSCHALLWSRYACRARSMSVCQMAMGRPDTSAPAAAMSCLCIRSQAAKFGVELLLLALATVILEGSRGRLLEILHDLL